MVRAEGQNSFRPKRNLMNFLRELFTWWNAQTPGTRWYTFRRGRLIGADQAGNRYYRDDRSGRRWVIYNGLVEASKVPPDWHAWLHAMRPDPPARPAPAPRWRKPHLPNMTGTPRAWRPQGSLLTQAQRPAATGDYQPWQPGGAVKTKQEKP